MSTSRKRSGLRSSPRAGSAAPLGAHPVDVLPEEKQVRVWFDALPERRVSERVMQNLAAAAREAAAGHATSAQTVPFVERLRHWLGLDSLGYAPAMGWGLAALLFVGVLGHFAALGQLDTVADTTSASAETALAWDYELEDVYADWTSTTADESGIATSYTGLTADLGDGVGTQDAFDLHVTNLQSSLALLAEDIDEF